MIFYNGDDDDDSVPQPIPDDDGIPQPIPDDDNDIDDPSYNSNIII